MTVMIYGRISRRAFAIAGLGAITSVKAVLAQPPAPASPAPGGSPLYRIDLPAASLPPAPVAFGASGAVMAPGTTVVYPEGSAGQSVAVDHVLAGDYEVESDSELIHIDTNGNLTHIAPRLTTTVAAGETIVFLHNEAQQRITAGGEETRTISIGFFSLERGTNETTVGGTLDQEILGGIIIQTVPESGVTLTIVAPEDAAGLTDSIAQIPMTLSSGEQWTAVLLPLAGEATPIA